MNSTMDCIDFKWNLICRTCLTQFEDEEHLHPLEDQDSEESLLKKLKKYIPYHFNVDQNLEPFPNQICINCIQKLQIVTEFYETCLKSQTILKSLLETSANQEKDNGSTASTLLMETENGTISYTFPKGLQIKKLEKKITEVPQVNEPQEPISTQEDTQQPYYILIPNIKDYENTRDDFSIIQQIESSSALVGFRQQSGDKRYNHVCKICNNWYKYPHLLNTHIKRHLEDKNYPCNICGKRFVIPFELKRHQRVHTGLKPYSCKFCDKCFADFSSKTKHERIHSGDRPYSCKICKKSFSYSHVLNNHLLTHTGERKYQCSICKKKFVKNHHLKYHLKIHNQGMDHQQTLNVFELHGALELPELTDDINIFDSNNYQLVEVFNAE